MCPLITAWPFLLLQVTGEGVSGVALEHAYTSASAAAAVAAGSFPSAIRDASTANGSHDGMLDSGSTAPPAVQSPMVHKALAGQLPAPSPVANGKTTAADTALPASSGHLPPQSHWGGGHSNQTSSQMPQQPAVSTAPTHGSTNSSATSSPQRPAWTASDVPAASSWPSQPVLSSFAVASKQGGLELDHRGSAAQLPLAPAPKSPALPLGSSPPRTVRSVLGKRQDSEAESELDHELMVSLIPDLGIGLSPSRLEPGQGAENSQEGALNHRFPTRRGHPICDFYQKTGHCKVREVGFMSLSRRVIICLQMATARFAVQYGAACRFDHPLEFAVELNRKGLPIRPGEPICGFYAKKGECRYGATMTRLMPCEKCQLASAVSRKCCMRRAVV